MICHALFLCSRLVRFFSSSFFHLINDCSDSFKAFSVLLKDCRCSICNTFNRSNSALNSLLLAFKPTDAAFNSLIKLSRSFVLISSAFNSDVSVCHSSAVSVTGAAFAENPPNKKTAKNSGNKNKNNLFLCNRSHPFMVCAIYSHTIYREIKKDLRTHPCKQVPAALP